MISREQFIQAGAYLAIALVIDETDDRTPPPLPKAVEEFFDAHLDEEAELDAELAAEIEKVVATQREIAQAILEGAVR